MLVLQKGLILPVPMYGGSYFFIQPYMNIIKLMLYNDKIKCIIKGWINFIGRMN